MQFTMFQMFIVITFTCLVLGVFIRGNYLLGFGAGNLFALLAAGTLFVVWRVFSLHRKFQVLRRFVAIVFAVSILTFLAFPAYFSPGLARVIENHDDVRVTRPQLADILSGDPRFSKLHYVFDFRRSVDVEICGRIKSESDLLALREEVFRHCPKISTGRLFWKLSIEESGTKHQGWDRDIFGHAKEKVGG